MRLLNIPHNALVFVGDGRKALFLRNDGNPLHPSLKMEQVHEDENPPTREQGTDRPGRLNSPMGQRTAVEAADWHHLEQHRFARRVAGAMEQLVRERDVKALVVVAPPANAGRSARSPSCRRQGAHHRRGPQGSHQASDRRDRAASDGRALRTSTERLNAPAHPPPSPAASAGPRSRRAPARRRSPQRCRNSPSPAPGASRSCRAR